MGQVLAKISDFVKNIISRCLSNIQRFFIDASSTTKHTSKDKIDEARQQDSHVINIPRADQPQPADLSFNSNASEIVEEKDVIITIPDAHVVNIGHDNVNKGKGVYEHKTQKSQFNLAPSASSTRSSGALKLVDHNNVAKEEVGAQPSQVVRKKNIWIKHYCSSHRILLVGEGDFSFSACLAKAFGSASNMVATSLDSLDFLKKNYANAMSNISYLKKNGSMVIHNVDAGEMANHHLLSGLKFDRIIYNFPLAGFFRDSSRSI
ncbi:Heavy metal-associated isoprenylated plant protein, partial [Thalictrum thalictroides]